MFLSCSSPLTDLIKIDFLVVEHEKALSLIFVCSALEPLVDREGEFLSFYLLR